MELVAGRYAIPSAECEVEIHACVLDWQDERPPAPSYLRVLYLGRMLQDDESLNSTSTTLVSLFLWHSCFFRHLGFSTDLNTLLLPANRHCAQLLLCVDQKLDGQGQGGALGSRKSQNHRHVALIHAPASW